MDNGWDVNKWTKNHQSATVSKWRWLWQQFLCCCGISKRAWLFVSIDRKARLYVKVWGIINNAGDFEVTYIAANE